MDESDNLPVHMEPSELLGPLDGSRLKIVRAEQHIKLLRAKIRRHLKRHTQDIVFADANDQNTSIKSKKLMKPIPAMLSAIVGDCVTNCRAALDYVMWELILKYLPGKLDLTKHTDRNIAGFPLYDEVGGRDSPYANRFNRFTNLGLPADIIAEIKAVQPLNAGYEPLLMLTKLVNTDKHQMPLLATAAFDGFMMLDTFLLKELIAKQAASNGGRYEIDLGTFTISLGNNASSVVHTKGDMDVYTEPTIYVTWQDIAMPREPVDRTLENIVKCVANIIPRFEGFL